MALNLLTRDVLIHSLSFIQQKDKNGTLPQLILYVRYFRSTITEKIRNTECVLLFMTGIHECGYHANEHQLEKLSCNG